MESCQPVKRKKKKKKMKEEKEEEEEEKKNKEEEVMFGQLQKYHCLLHLILTLLVRH
jgi:hypothetical protein